MKKIILLSSLFISVISFGQVPTNGLAGYWPFNGNAYDESYHGHNGIVYGASDTTNRFNIPNSSYYFNGVSDRIVIPNSPLLDFAGQSITISAWIKPVSKWSQYNRATIFAKGGWDLGSGYELLVRGDMLVELNIVQTILTTDDTLLLNTYTHVVATFDDENDIFKIYFNGVERKSAPIFNSINSNDRPAIIGRRDDGNEWVGNFNGFIDDVCVYNRALSATEINDLYLYQEKIHYTNVSVTDTLIINVNLSGFKPLKFENKVKIFPNPTKDNITIDCGENYNLLENYRIKITNNFGLVVYEYLITQRTTTLDINNWTGNGLYLIYFMKDSSIVDVKKLILQ